MDVDVKQRIMEYMEKCGLCTIATVSAEGQPSASTVFFKNTGLNIYFNTGRETQKVQNILANRRVAIAMQQAGSVPKVDRDIKGIQYVGEASILAEGDTSEAPKAMMARHNAFNSAKPGNSVIVKVSPLKIYLVDYSRGFRYREVIEL